MLLPLTQHREQKVPLAMKLQPQSHSWVFWPFFPFLCCCPTRGFTEVPADPGDGGVEAGTGNGAGFKRQREKVREGE